MPFLNLSVLVLSDLTEPSLTFDLINGWTKIKCMYHYIIVKQWMFELQQRVTSCHCNKSLSFLNFWLDVSRANTGRNFISCLSIKVVALSWLLFPMYVGHRHRSQLCNSVSCAFCHPRQHLFHKNNIQLLALKWRLHHMPASHLVSARGAGVWLHLRRKQRRRANLLPLFFFVHSSPALLNFHPF